MTILLLLYVEHWVTNVFSSKIDFQQLQLQLRLCAAMLRQLAHLAGWVIASNIPFLNKLYKFIKLQYFSVNFWRFGNHCCLWVYSMTYLSLVDIWDQQIWTSNFASKYTVEWRWSPQVPGWPPTWIPAYQKFAFICSRSTTSAFNDYWLLTFTDGVSVAHWHSARWAWNGYQPGMGSIPRPGRINCFRITRVHSYARFTRLISRTGKRVWQCPL